MKVIQKIFLSVALILSAAGFSFAQTYSIVPNDTISVYGVFEDLETLIIQQHNNSTSTINLKWEKVSESVPASWVATVCDNSVCYPSLVDSGMMNPVSPAGDGFLLLHVTPRLNYGTAIIRYSVWDDASPAVKDTLTFIIIADPTAGISDTENKFTFSIYPNPATDRINITSNLQQGFRYLISDALGKEVEKGFSSTNSFLVAMENFPDGIYRVTILSESNLGKSKPFIVQH